MTFVRTDQWIAGWSGLPDAEEAARRVLPAYLRAFGPAGREAVDQWLMRGATPKARLRGWFDAVSDLVTEVDVEGRPGYARTGDLDDLAAARPTGTVRLLPGFDQTVLGPGTADEVNLAWARRAEVGRAAR